MERCAIILAGGLGTRLRPLTTAVSKQALPVYDKPMIYYPISLAMLSGIRDILIISDPVSLPIFKRMLGDGSGFGVEFSYVEQKVPNGLAQAFVLGRDFIGERSVALFLGDNIFYGSSLTGILREVNSDPFCFPTIFAYEVSDPRAYGVVEIGQDGTAVSIEEKPENPKSKFAVPGMYFYPNTVVQIAERLEPSQRGEYEITDINRKYMELGTLKVRKLPRGIAWLDSGTFTALNDASNFVRTIQERTGMKIADLVEIGTSSGWIGKETV